MWYYYDFAMRKVLSLYVQLFFYIFLNRKGKLKIRLLLQLWFKMVKFAHDSVGWQFELGSGGQFADLTQGHIWLCSSDGSARARQSKTTSLMSGKWYCWLDPSPCDLSCSRRLTGASSCITVQECKSES